MYLELQNIKNKAGIITDFNLFNTCIGCCNKQMVFLQKESQRYCGLYERIKQRVTKQ